MYILLGLGTLIATNSYKLEHLRLECWNTDGLVDIELIKEIISYTKHCSGQIELIIIGNGDTQLLTNELNATIHTVTVSG